MELHRGELLGDFEVLRHISSGGMGDVYLARDRRLGREVALKVVSAGAPQRRRLEAEARVTASLNHPGIVTLYGYGEDQGRAYLALEYVEGTTLRERLESAPPPLWDSVRIALGIAGALREAHRRCVIHRDLKPENVLLDARGHVRLLDFGLALSAAAVPDDDADSDDYGTPRYMAPEQWLGLPLTSAADVWALGLVLYELVAGEHPFADAAGRVLRLKVCDAQPVPPPSTLAPELDLLVARCVRKDPSRRPEIGAVTAELARILGAPAAARPAPAARAREVTAARACGVRHATRAHPRNPLSLGDRAGPAVGTIPAAPARGLPVRGS